MLCVTGVYLRARLQFPCFGQKMNQRSLNSHYRQEAAATYHPWLSSDTAVWSFGRAGSLRQRTSSGMRMSLLSHRATSVKPKTSSKNQHLQKPTLVDRYYSLDTTLLFIEPNNAFCIGYHIIMLRILFN